MDPFYNSTMRALFILVVFISVGHCENLQERHYCATSCEALKAEELQVREFEHQPMSDRLELEQQLDDLELKKRHCLCDDL